MKEKCREENFMKSPSVLYALAATIWLILGLAGWNLIYMMLAVVFYILAFIKRKKKDE